MSERWNPWRELRRREHIVFELCDLPDGVGAAYVRRGERAAIMIDRRLSTRARRVALCHELIHDELGVTCSPETPKSWRAVLGREESRIDDEVALRLVPHFELVAFAERQADVAVHVTASLVADEFDVTAKVAERALRLLARRLWQPPTVERKAS